MLKIQLNKEIKDKIELGYYLKAKELVQFVIDNTECVVEGNKSADKIALQDIKIDGKYIKSAMVDIEDSLLILTF
ncbi:hypothetical protein FDC62_11365 [Clostridium botulinum]|uniref:hypothetical protein n=1 Tax=Clostridium botulinum TaxID=1491 RepID=UPI000991DB70|nr:hypothetical protein [Clostridium botulinum]NFO98781.1 hypothetical protein [Clostridium botulinum]OOV52303.1 hypothetical protein B1A66_04645 [Clostridium botulinum D/C]OOV54071.1 hypothetical protein B0673_11450 [Clostridium botulinum D/C]OOV58071.1 hypothetical protein B1A67_03485 [Clostridium botulinum D/C]